MSKMCKKKKCKQQTSNRNKKKHNCNNNLNNNLNDKVYDGDNEKELVEYVSECSNPHTILI